MASPHRSAPPRVWALAVAGLLACTTVEQQGPAYRQSLEGFKVGVTTRADAERLLGPPQYQAKEGELTRLAWTAGPPLPAGPASPGAAAAARMVILRFAPDGRLARPPEVAFPGGAAPRLDEPSLRPAGAPEPCRTDADCADGGTCRAGACRR